MSDKVSYQTLARGGITGMNGTATALVSAVAADETAASAAAAGALVRQAETEEQLVALWLHGRSPHTQRAYRRDIDRFLDFVVKPLQAVTLADVQAFADSLDSLAPASRARTLAAVKSLLAFGQRVGYLTFNIGAAVRLPKLKNTLAERLLPEAATQRLLALEPDLRNRVMLRLCYAAGLRVSELVGLKWRDLQPRANGEGQATIYGKGGKTRVILLPATVWQDLQELAAVMSTEHAGATRLDAPVFRSRKGGHLATRQAQRLVDAAAARAGIRADVSPHWLRHAHATHALERGAPIHLVKDTLGHASVATTDKYLHAKPTESSAKYLAV